MNFLFVVSTIFHCYVIHNIVTPNQKQISCRTAEFSDFKVFQISTAVRFHSYDITVRFVLVIEK